MQSQSKGYIDSHAHIYLPEFDPDRDRMIHSAMDNDITHILMPAIDSSTHEQMVSVQELFPNCLSMMGLHPCSVKEDPTGELEQVKDWLKKRSFIAIGEIGLDLHWDKTFLKQQYEAFHQQMQLAAELRLPVSIHSRKATRECIDVIRQYPAVRGVFHCFSGDVKEAEDVISAGWLLGIGGVVTFKNSGLDKTISSIGAGSLILETDAPYLAPVPYRGKRNESGYLKFVVEKLSLLLKLSSTDIAMITTQNCRSLFALPSRKA